MEEGVFVGDVVVVAGKNVCRVVAFEPDEVRHLVAVEVKDIIDSVALLKEELRAIDVAEERRALRPPCNARIHVCSGEIFIAGKPEGGGG